MLYRIHWGTLHFSALIWSLQLSIKKRIVQQNRLTIKEAFYCGGNRTKSRVPLNKTATLSSFFAFYEYHSIPMYLIEPGKKMALLAFDIHLAVPTKVPCIKGPCRPPFFPFVMFSKCMPSLRVFVPYFRE